MTKWSVPQALHRMLAIFDTFLPPLMWPLLFPFLPNLQIGVFLQHVDDRLCFTLPSSSALFGHPAPPGAIPEKTQNNHSLGRNQVTPFCRNVTLSSTAVAGASARL